MQLLVIHVNIIISYNDMPTFYYKGVLEITPRRVHHRNPRPDRNYPRLRTAGECTESNYTIIFKTIAPPAGTAQIPASM